MTSPDLRIVHFNDVYHIQPNSQDPIGGAARFVSVLNEYRDKLQYAGQVDLVVLFSGDAFNPSIESSLTKGRHMVPILRDAINVDAACCGNHDFDFGVSQMMYLVEQCQFPWLIGNVFDGEKPLGNGLQTYLLTATNGIKIGLMGFVEKEWLDTINSLPPDLTFIQPAEMAKELVPKMRDEGADIIIALTHMREINDVLLANSVSEGLIDIILGGHDHHYNSQIVNGIPILRSGSDFRQLSYIEARRTSSEKWTFKIERRDITSSIPEDPKTKEIVSSLSDSLQKRLEKPIGYTYVDLDARFTTVRMAESNYGSLICDMMRFYYNTDCALMAGGTMRGDQIYPAGILRLGDIISCFPFEDPCVIIRVPGSTILAALENSVSKVPALEGRFCQVSGLEFGYDPTRPSGDRVRWVNIAGEKLRMDRRYTITTRGYMARGKDGFESLNAKNDDVEVLVDEEHGVLLSVIIRQYFLSLRALSTRRRSADVSSLFRGLHKRQAGSGMLLPNNISHGRYQDERTETSDEEDEVAEAAYTSRFKRRLSVQEELRVFELKRRVAKKREILEKVGRNMLGNDGIAMGVDWCRSVRPQVEGRINIVTT